ncbi:MAG: hypothetical protein IAG10_19810 [Planctomycetaceae bacterium]|nr:hypothetical protein [Planctomycetaceae bacterium]
MNQYAFEIASTDDLNRLIEKLAATKTEVRQVRLSHLKEPSGLGWVTSVPAGNNIAVVFSLGDQAQIDEWYKRVRKPFGKMEFTAAPIAVPPTLTIFVQNKAVNLEQLKIPNGIAVTSGYVPTVFHQFNTKDEQKRKEEATRKPAPNEKLDPAAQAAADKIEAFLKMQKPLAPEAILENKFEGQATVEFLVSEVHTIDIDSIFMPGLSHAQIIKANVSGTKDGQEFLVTVSREIATRLLRLGIENPAEHFRGKRMRVSGTVERFEPPSAPSKTIYKIHVTSLDQLENIRKPADGS